MKRAPTQDTDARFVQFADPDAVLITEIGRAMSVALHRGSAVMCIATDVHRRLLEEHLIRCRYRSSALPTYSSVRVPRRDRRAVQNHGRRVARRDPVCRGHRCVRRSDGVAVFTRLDLRRHGRVDVCLRKSNGCVAPRAPVAVVQRCAPGISLLRLSAERLRHGPAAEARDRAAETGRATSPSFLKGQATVAGELIRNRFDVVLTSRVRISSPARLSVC